MTDIHVDEDNQNSKPIAYLDNAYYLTEKKGKGSTSKVYVGYAVNDNSYQQFSFKIMNLSNTNISLFKKEVQMLHAVSTAKKVVKFYHSGTGQLTKLNGKSKSVLYIVLEYLENFDLSYYIFRLKGFGEDFGKIIFSHLLDSVESIHNAGVVHRDIKPQNIMLSKDFEFKLIDFGFATNATTGALTEYLGTLNHVAPELLEMQPYNGVCNDVFSLAVTLFFIVTGDCPCFLHFKNDKLYKHFIEHNYREFWLQKNIKVTANFMELINNMLAFDPTQRLSISEIRQSKWMQDINLDLVPYLKDLLIKTRYK
jgi:serine/threonine protein kinase